MKPLRHPLLPDGRGRRLPAMLDAINRRDQLILEATDRYFPGVSGREIARRLRVALLRYREGRFRRTRVERTCLTQHLGRLDELLWMILKTRDTIPSERLVRLVLSHTARE
jgi:hypothetical protein